MWYLIVVYKANGLGWYLRGEPWLVCMLGSFVTLVVVEVLQLLLMNYWAGTLSSSHSISDRNTRVEDHKNGYLYSE